jgi:hypothetical protein
VGGVLLIFASPPSEAIYRNRRSSFSTSDFATTRANWIAISGLDVDGDMSTAQLADTRAARFCDALFEVSAVQCPLH